MEMTGFEGLVHLLGPSHKVVKDRIKSCVAEGIRRPRELIRDLDWIVADLKRRGLTQSASEVGSVVITMVDNAVEPLTKPQGQLNAVIGKSLHDPHYTSSLCPLDSEQRFVDAEFEHSPNKRAKIS